MWRAAAISLSISLVFLAKWVSGQETVQVNTEKVVEVLKTNKDLAKREAAVAILEVIGPGDSKVLPALFDALKNDESEVIRTAAAQALGRIGTKAKEADIPKVAGVLKDALAKEKAGEVRKALAQALGGKMAEYAQKAIPLLGAALKDTHPGTSAAAAASLKDFDKEALQVMPQLLEAIKDASRDRFTRIYCAQIVSTHSKDATVVVPILMALLAEKDVHVSLKQVAVDGLANFERKAQDAADPLLSILKDSKEPVLLRQSTALALSKIRPDSKLVWPTVKGLMTDENPAIRTISIRLAAKTCREEAEFVPILIKLCDDENVATQVAAIQELGELGKNAAAAEKTLERLVKTSGRQNIRDLAKAALKQIQGK